MVILAILTWLSSWWPGDVWNSTGPALEAASVGSDGGVIALKRLTPLPKDAFGSEEIPVEVSDAVLASVLGTAFGAACERELIACGDGSVISGEESAVCGRSCPSSSSGLVRPGVRSANSGDADVGFDGVTPIGRATVGVLGAGGSSTT